MLEDDDIDLEADTQGLTGMAADIAVEDYVEDRDLMKYMWLSCGSCPVNPVRYAPYFNRAPEADVARSQRAGPFRYVTGEGAHSRHELDVYVPAGDALSRHAEPRPVLVFFHGGSLRAGTNSTNLLYGHSAVGQRIASRCGVVTVLPKYRFVSLSITEQLLFSALASVALAGVGVFAIFLSHLLNYALAVEPAPLLSLFAFSAANMWEVGLLMVLSFLAANVFFALIERRPRGLRCDGPLADAAAVLKWVREHANEYGGDPKRIVVMGHSAGGYLAAMRALRDPPESGIVACITVGGVLSVKRLFRKNVCGVLSMGYHAFSWDIRRHPEMSPVTYARNYNGNVRFLLLNAQYDFWLEEDAKEMEHYLRARGVQVSRAIVPLERHRSQVFSDILMGHVRDFLDDVFQVKYLHPVE